MLVLRNQACQFFYIKALKEYNQKLIVSKFSSSPELEELVGVDENMIHDYIIIPQEISGSSQLELIVADPEEGFHLLFSEDEDYARHFVDLRDFNQDEN